MTTIGRKSRKYSHSGDSNPARGNANYWLTLAACRLIRPLPLLSPLPYIRSLTHSLTHSLATSLLLSYLPYIIYTLRSLFVVTLALWQYTHPLLLHTQRRGHVQRQRAPPVEVSE
jgi:hypothetical protein